MASTETIPAQRPQAQDIERMMQLSNGLVLSAALQSITRLKIADLLADGALPVSRLAVTSGTNPDALYRIMRLLASVGVFAELPGKVFAITPMSQLMRSNTPGSMRDMILWISNRFHFQVFGEMEHSLRTGQPAVEKVCGKPAFEAIFGDPEIASDFNLAMTAVSRRIAPALIEVYDFSEIGTLMDVAGGHGAVLCEILARYPKMKGILLDIPNVIDEANGYICSLKMEERCQTIRGDFFKEIPAGADAYYMQHILHDWNDERSLKILANCRRALEGHKNARTPGASSGCLLIVDSIVPETSDPHPSKWLDMSMMLLPGGRERTRPEWDALLAKAGFEVTRIFPMKTAESLIEAKVRA